MSETSQTSPFQTVKELNATPLSQSVSKLFATNKASLDPTALTLAELARWAVKNPPVEQGWAEAVEAALATAEADDPAALYENLEQALTGDEPTLQVAGHLMVQTLLDLIPADSQPA